MKSNNYFNVIMGFHTKAECTITLDLGDEFEKGDTKSLSFATKGVWFRKGQREEEMATENYPPQKALTYV